MVGHPDRGHEHDPTPLLPPGAPTQVDGQPVQAVGHPQSGAFARGLAAVVLDEASYAPGTGVVKWCAFRGTVVFRIWSGARSVDVVVCFSCDRVAVQSLRERGGRIGWTQGDVDQSRARLVGLAKQALPNAPEVGGLAITREK
jgi:hypothetical protein